MSEWEDKLNAILSSPETMEQIMSLASSLSGGGENSSGAATASEGEPNGQNGTVQSPPPPTADPLGGLGSLLGGFDPSMLQKLLPLVQMYTAGGDEKQALLEALKPFLKQESREKVDKAIRIARLSRVIRGSMQLFREDGHV